LKANQYPNIKFAIIDNSILGGLPGILQAADTTDRRTLLQSLFTSVILEPHLATKAKARDKYRELLLKLVERIGSTDWWAGWAPGTRSDTPYTLLHPRRVAA
jgi:hypothetical protein